MAPAAALSATLIACVGSTVGAQAAMVPFSVGKMKRLGPLSAPAGQASAT